MNENRIKDLKNIIRRYRNLMNMYKEMNEKQENKINRLLEDPDYYQFMKKRFMKKRIHK